MADRVPAPAHHGRRAFSPHCLPPLCQRLRHLTTQYQGYFILYIATFTVALPILCHNIPTSLYFVRPWGGNSTKHAQEYLRQDNTRRLEAAQAYFRSINASKAGAMLQSFAGDNSDHIHISVGVITTSRNRHLVDDYEPNYLTQAVWSLFVLLQEGHREGLPFHVRISVCDVDSHPQTYKEAAAVSAYVPTHHKYLNKRPPIIHALEKEKRDYVFCMNVALQDTPRPDYVLLVEDDALPHPHLLPVLNDVIHHHLENVFHAGALEPRTDDVAYIKFFHPERLVHFLALDRERLPEWLACSVLLATLLTMICRMYPSKHSLTTTWLVFLVYSLLVTLVIGRPTLLELRRFFAPHLYSLTPAPSCCTPAMLYPRDGAISIMNYLDKVQCRKNYGKDSALDDYIRATKHKAYLVQPNLFKHIGLYSAIHRKILDPYVV